MNSKHLATLKAIFARPVRSNIAWRDIESLFRSLDASLEEGRGSRVRVVLRGAEAVFHRPHPKPDTSKGAVEAVRDFLLAAGMEDPWSTKATLPDRSASTRTKVSSRGRSQD